MRVALPEERDEDAKEKKREANGLRDKGENEHTPPKVVPERCFIEKKFGTSLHYGWAQKSAGGAIGCPSYSNVVF